MINKVIFGGRLVANPKVQLTNSGVAVANFRVACNQKMNGAEQTTFMDVVAFRKNAVNAEKYLGKGDPVLIEGELSVSDFVGQDGVKRKIVKIVAQRIKFMGKKASKEEKQDTEPAGELEPF